MKRKPAAWARTILFLAGLTTLLGACASVEVKKPSAKADQKFDAYSGKILESFRKGKDAAASDPDLVANQEALVLDETLFSFYAPYAGAQRLLNFADQHPGYPLLPVYLAKDAKGRYFDFQDSEAFKSGDFFNNYESGLFDPFYREALLQYALGKDWTADSFAPLSLALKDAARLTPRWADHYPTELGAETRSAFQDYISKHPEGPLSDRFRLYLLMDKRDGAWSAGAAGADGELASLEKSTQDPVLRMQIQDLRAAEWARPERSFWWSLGLPGTGQWINGDLQGGVIMAGLAGAAWWWAVSRLVAGIRDGDPGTRRAAFGDAAFGAPLVLLAHGFAAANASAQAHFLNITLEWEIMSKPRLQDNQP